MRYLKNVSLILMMFFYFPVCINAQHNQWTWAGGSNSSNQYGNYGPKGTSGNNFIPGARIFGLSWADNYGNLWLFGGQGYSTSSDASGGKTIDYLNDLWRYHNGQWAWVGGANFHNQNGNYGPQGTALSTNYPGARNYSTGCVDNMGNYWMYGGQGYASDPNNQYCLDDLWKWDGSYWTWVFGNHNQSAISYHSAMGIADPGNYPGSREAGNSWTDNNGNFWLFGGLNDDNSPYIGSRPTNLCNDVWKWDGSNWTWMSGNNTFNQSGVYTGPAGTLTPGAREYSAGCRDKFGNFWLFGGLDQSHNRYNDLWEWNGTSWIWVSGSNSTNSTGTYTGPASSLVPAARAGGMLWVDETGSLWLFGGATIVSGSSPSYFNDLWKWDGTNWTWISGGSSALPSSDPSTGNYGSLGSSSSSNTPGVRTGGGYAADKGGYIWLIGGGDFYINNVSANMLNDVWKFQYGYNTVNDGNWNIPGTWENSTVPAPTDFAIIKNNVSITDAESINGLKVNSGHILTINPGNLQVSGTLNNSGSIDATTGTITFNGTTPQGFSTGMVKNKTIQNLTINNSNYGLLLNDTLNLTGVLNLSGGTFKLNGLFTLISNATSTGAVMPNGGSISGNVIVQRYLSQNQRGWRLLGNPLTTGVSYNSLALGSATPIDMTYGTSSSAGASAETYDPASNTWLGVNSSADLWNSESGIALFIRGQQGQGFGTDYPSYNAEFGIPGHVKLAIYGPLNLSDVSVPTTTSAFNLIANPFAAPISLSAVLAANSGFSGTVAIYNPSKQSTSPIVKAGGYNPYTPSGAIGNASDLILPSMGAFFVQSTTGSSLSIPTSAIFTGTPSPGTVANYGGFGLARIKLSVNSGTINYDDVNFQFDANSSAATGDTYDFGKLPNTYLNFYSISSNHQQMAFDERNAISQIIPLGLKSSITNNFSISVDQYSLPEGLSLVLKDKLLNTSTVLQAGVSYNFSITADTATQGENRFEIDVNKAVVNTITNDNTGVTKVTIGPNPSTDFIEVKTPVSGIAGASYNIRLLGTNGNPVSSISIAAGSSVQIPLKGYASGLYLVEVNDGKQIATYKIIKN